MCCADSRSVQATVILCEAGFGDVANLAGGMLRWRAQAMPSKAAAPRAAPHLELLEELDHRLLIVGIQFAKPQNDLA